jgi:hypothetical protein
MKDTVGQYNFDQKSKMDKIISLTGRDSAKNLFIKNLPSNQLKTANINSQIKPQECHYTGGIAVSPGLHLN